MLDKYDAEECHDERRERSPSEAASFARIASFEEKKSPEEEEIRPTRRKMAQSVAAVVL